MKGSQKFWIIIGTIFMIYGNYLCFFSDFLPKEEKDIGAFKFIIGVTILMGDLVLIIGIIGGFFTEILPKFNNWLDKKF